MEEFYIDKTLHCGRPEDCDKRNEKEVACYDLLDELEMEYCRIDHDVANTIKDCEAVEQYLGGEIYKNLFLCNRQKTSFYLLIMQGEKPFKTKDFSKLIGSSRLSFAGPEDLEKYLNLTPGSVTILGLMHDKENAVQLALDRPVTQGEYFCCHPCMNSASLRLKTEEVLHKFLPYVRHEPIIVDLPEVELEAE